MTTPALPTFQDGVLVHASDLNAICSNITALYQAALGGTRTAAKPQCVLSISSTTHACTTGASNNTTPGLIAWEGASINNDGMWTVTSPTIMTVQTSGTYRINLQVAVNVGWGASAALGLHLFIMVNGTSAATNTVSCWRDFYSSRSRCSATVSLQPASTIAAAAIYGYGNRYNSATAINFLTTTGGCRFEAVRIGPA
jgi:hypothetical protein